MSTVAGKRLRIGEVAELTGTTPRTIRYYEEIGLLPDSGARAQGQHRCYTDADVARMREILRLKDLLGLSLEQLSKLLEAETARAELRQEYQQAEDAATQRRILEEALGHIAGQLELVTDRKRQLDQLERELVERSRTLRERLAELSA
ncbi:MAG: MerR family transcriptional regulator [Solirubrobacterales bacterium]|nr:MerR family transcriptional regulator [Solirubrobacterales bacterium]MBV9714534.1 MerR family transcriptional regulator [Solirubrobacterales bacterium]